MSNDNLPISKEKNIHMHSNINSTTPATPPSPDPNFTIALDIDY